MATGMFNISELLENYVVYIPEIQRDYAQGRKNSDVKAIRNKLLDDAYKVLLGDGENDQLILNYIYGVPDNDKIILIDGQQRITFLFLLKWFLAVKSNSELCFLKKLIYATRDSSKEFCEFLENNGNCIQDCEYFKDGKCTKESKSATETSSKKSCEFIRNGTCIRMPSDVIKNHIKFKKRWLNDPTVINMITMLDSISEKSKETIENPEKMHSNLDNIKFSFISLDGFKRTDELYAAMNSRGKQLTPFELVKGELLKKDSGLASVINDEWMPAFWNLSLKYADSKENKEQYAADNHDRFLYNFYSFVVQMIWWSTSTKEVKKGEALPSIMEMTKSIIESKANIDWLKFALGLAENDLSRDYKFDELVRWEERPSDIPSDKVVLFDGYSGDRVQFFELCCKGDNFTQAGRCYLWAYICYKYDERNNKISDNRSLLDYYLLMRSLYMWRASNETPTSVGKLSLNEEQLGDVVRPFSKITEDDREYIDKNNKWRSQYEVFFSDKKNKYETLNNPMVRGVTDNIGEISDDMLLENLTWMWKSDELACFKRLASCGFASFKCAIGGYDDRVFLPVKEKTMMSLFSLRGWGNSQDFINLLKYLRNNRLADQEDKTYKCSDWEYYVIEYPSFRDGTYGQYVVSGDGMNVNASFIENERATKNKTRNPFLYEVYTDYQSRHPEDKISYSDYIENNKLSFKGNEDGTFEWKYNGQTFTYSQEDCIKLFLNQINQEGTD